MKAKQTYTVKQLAELAGVSVRTLHYYDEIGLLKPSAVGHNNYRYYDDDALFRLQQILFFRELELDLLQIKAILDDPQFDKVTALQTHRRRLAEKIDRLQKLSATIDNTILHLVGEVSMSKKRIFEGFDKEQEQRYAEEAAQRWDAETVKASYKLWNSYSPEKQAQIKQEGGAIYQGLAANMSKGPTDPAIQAMLGNWHQHLRYFYEPSLEVLRGLGNAYNDDPDFNATFTAIHPDLPPFLQAAINHYVDTLEMEWLERELAILEE